ncbi:hypothetical protein [Candidatus Formimonas warabiya]|nr:hypothetical protein [Candidatus Formimonas warabiya]
MKKHAILGISGLFLVFVITLNSNIQSYGIYGDESTHLLQAKSIALDKDLKFSYKDVEHFYEDGWTNAPGGLFLKINNKGEVFFAKPILYSLYSSFFVFFFGTKGIILGNGILLYILIVLSYLWLKKYNSELLSLIFSLLFYLGSNAFGYVFVIHPDIFIATLLFLSWFFLNLYCDTENEKLYADDLANIKGLNRSFISKKYLFLFVSAVFMGLSLYEKLPFGIFFICAIVCLIIKKYYKGVLIFSIIVTCVFVIPTLVNIFQDGNYSSYKGERYYFGDNIPGVNFGSENSQEKFDANLVKEFKSKGISPQTEELFSFKKVLVNLVHTNIGLIRYFADWLIGRNLGIILYSFPIIACLFFAYKNRDKVFVLVILFGIFTYTIFYFMLIPNNFYGGSTSFGNRYFLQVLPLFIFLVKEFTGYNYYKHLIFISIIFVTIFLGPFYQNPYALPLRKWDNIENNFIYTIFPIETTQIETIYYGRKNSIVKLNDDVTLYKLNGVYDNESDGNFWTKGKHTSNFVIKSSTRINQISFNLYNGFKINKVRIQFSNQNKTLNFIPFQSENIVINISDMIEVKQGLKAYWVYKFSIGSLNGFTPKLYVNQNLDDRFLGVRIQNIIVQ